MQELKVKIPTGQEIAVLGPKGELLKGENDEVLMEAEINEVVIDLNEPTFDQFRGAMLAGETPSGKMDKLAVGNFFLVACVVDEDREKLAQIEADPKAHAPAALDAYDLISVYETELKKK